MVESVLGIFTSKRGQLCHLLTDSVTFLSPDSCVYEMSMIL